MKFTLSWLKDHLETDASLHEVVETLTRIGLEVEHVEDPAARLKNFSLARVLEARPHPNADRLQVCLVDVGAGAPAQVVCGAPNARAGLKTVFAPPGAIIPSSGAILTKGVIRGVESNGMLCSGAELGLTQDLEGIIELAEDAPVGAPFAAYAGLADPVIEFNLLPNRPDTMGVEGVARDLAAAGLGRFKGRAVTPPGDDPASVGVAIEVAPREGELAPAFALRRISGVRNGASPEWLRRRLAAIGLRPINTLVDITNYLTFDRARPLHVFDAAKVEGDLVVRRARAGETLAALDGKTYALDEEMIVVADASGPVSLAGVIGGAATGCDETTTDALIESAHWDRSNVARTGRKLGLNSDARYRFERGVDPLSMLPGLDLATSLALKFCGGTASRPAIAGKIPVPDHRVVFFLSEVARLTGLELDPSEATGILERLGFELGRSPGNSDRFVVKAPSFRPDIEGPADLVEEIVRIAGVDRVVARPFARDADAPATTLTPLQKRTRAARRALAAAGLVEAVTWSFVSHARAQAFGGGAAALALANPIAADLSDMRPSLLPGLIAAAQRNADRGHGDVALFEVGQIFRGDAETDQKIAAAGLRQGLAKTTGAGRSWAAKPQAADAFDAKADAMALLAALGVPAGGVQIVRGGPDWMHPGRCGTLQFGPKTPIGSFGEIHPRALAELGADAPMVGFEVILNDIPAPKSKPTRTKPKFELSELMPLTRDFAFVVDRSAQAGDIVRAALASDRALVAGAEVFDVYEGPGVEDGKKSVAISVTLQPRDKTLTEPEIEAVAARLVAEVAQRTGASLRG